MALFKYFKHDKSLPDPQNTLSEKVPSTSIKEANKEVKAISDKCGKEHAPYMVATPEQKAKVGKYAAENGTTNAIRHFSKELLSLKESTVQGWKKAYLCELASKNRAGDKRC